jgi:hypothetical protein
MKRLGQPGDHPLISNRVRAESDDMTSASRAEPAQTDRPRSTLVDSLVD